MHQKSVDAVSYTVFNPRRIEGNHGQSGTQRFGYRIGVSICFRRKNKKIRTAVFAGKVPPLQTAFKIGVRQQFADNGHILAVAHNFKPNVRVASEKGKLGEILFDGNSSDIQSG